MTTTNNRLGEAVGSEGMSIYLNRDDINQRYVVTLAMSYGLPDGVSTPKEAAAAALALTRDEGCAETVWFVFDRQTGEHHCFDQGEFESIMHEKGMI